MRALRLPAAPSAAQRRTRRRSSSLDEAAPLAAEPAAAPPPVEEAKTALLRLALGTSRGMNASQPQRVQVQEAALALEAFGGPLDTEVLAGSWRLVYTTASDVLVLLEAERRSFGLLTVGDILQVFDAYGSVENVINVSGPLGAAALRVRARYERAGARTIRLAFTEAGADSVQPSAALETLLAPALLPRSAPQFALLAALRELNIFLPLPGVGRDALAEADGVLGAANAGAYLLSFCDAAVLVGRALTGGGLFIFQRAL